MPGPCTRYPASRTLLLTGLGGLALAAVSASIALTRPIAWIATGALAASALIALVLGLIPAVEIDEAFLKQRRKPIPWKSVYQVERLARNPLVIRLTLASREETLVIYAGNRDSREALLHDVRLMARGAVIDGIPYREFWGGDEVHSPVEEGRRHSRPRRYPLLLSEDEAEIERLFQQLKTVGHIEPNKSPDEE